MELVTEIDGDALENTKDNRVLRVISTLEETLNALPPQEVIDAVLERIRLEKHAPRANEEGCAALEADLRSNAISFAARDAASATKVTVDLPPFPTRDPPTLTRRREEYEKWTGAPAAQQANVCWGVQYDSYALGTAAPLQKWPKLRGRPTLVADPLTKIEGGELTTIKPMDVLAWKLVRGEKSMKGKPGKEESG